MEKTGINQTRIRFRLDQLFIVKGALRQADPVLRSKRKPLCFEDEIPGYVYPVTKDGKRNKEIPDEGCPDHGCDAARAAVAWSFLKDLTPTVKTSEIVAQRGTIEFEYEKAWRERQRRKGKRPNKANLW